MVELVVGGGFLVSLDSSILQPLHTWTGQKWCFMWRIEGGAVLRFFGLVSCGWMSFFPDAFTLFPLPPKQAVNKAMQVESNVEEKTLVYSSILRLFLKWWLSCMYYFSEAFIPVHFPSLPNGWENRNGVSCGGEKRWYVLRFFTFMGWLCLIILFIRSFYTNFRSILNMWMRWYVWILWNCIRRGKISFYYTYLQYLLLLFFY